MSSRTSGASSTLCVEFTREQCPQTFDRATAVFSVFGDMARIDMSFANAMGIILVTFFDVRSAELALATFKSRSKRLPPEAHDFRTISISSSLFAKLPHNFTSFESFGDIAGVAISGEDMLIEFYDMRAAQRLLLAVPGSHPQPPVGALPSGLGPTLGLCGAAAHGEKAPLLGSGSPAAAAAVAAAGAPGKAGLASPVAPGAVAPGTANPATSPTGKPGGAANAVPAGQHAPAREKMDAKDLAKFDIVAEKIWSGEDTRTTVMVRNIPRACSREDLVDLLQRCGTDHYGFFYMPFDKRRDIHCGFAFIDFETPQDVLKLYEVLKEWPRWWPAPPNGGAPPALSYARLQGQEQLMRHFSASAVMYDNDTRKRPVFYREGAPPGGAGEKEKVLSQNQEEADQEAMHLQPKYVHLTSNDSSSTCTQVPGMVLPNTGFHGGGLTVGVSDFTGVDDEVILESTVLGA